MQNSLFIFTPCLPHYFHPIHWDQIMIIICQYLGSRPTQAQQLFTLVLRLLGTTCCLVVQSFQLLPLRNIWRHISSTWLFPHRYWHARWTVDVMELFLQFCCWTLIRLSRHWAWLCRGYWRYRNWLINWFMCPFWTILINIYLTVSLQLLTDSQMNFSSMEWNPTELLSWYNILPDFHLLLRPFIDNIYKVLPLLEFSLNFDLSYCMIGLKTMHNYSFQCF